MAALVELFLGSTSAPVDWEAEAYPTYGGLRRAPLARRLLPRRPVPPRPTRLRGFDMQQPSYQILDE
ncbi:ASC1-like protein 1 [Panicum miliaceum]|uniref:ASC1-like protein 1 n=1 Tax=Panicum miliaceum TaxID=4540 RepID=A0A3L6QVK9_PANMI|nr:ASC1-like protein 1 [Panicum miliaceum]